MKAPEAEGRAPTVVLFDGWTTEGDERALRGLDFARRGMNTLAIDGPGQGEALRLRRSTRRHDYEVPALRPTSSC